MNKKIQKIRKQFPYKPNNLSYFAWCSVCSLPNRVKKAQGKFLKKFYQSGLNGILPDLLKIDSEIRPLAAKFVNAQIEETIFVKNTTDAINMIALAYPWKENDEVLSFEGEYPVNIYPWLNTVKRNKIKFSLLPETSIFDLDKFNTAITEKTKIVSLSAVEFSSGFRAPLGEISAIIREKEKKYSHKIILLVDASQALGVLDINFKRDNIDILCASGHKWLLSDFAAGLAYIKKDLFPLLHPPIVGASSMEDEWNYLDYDFTLKKDGGRYEGGTGNYSGILGLGESLKMINSVDAKSRESRVLKLRSFLTTKLKEAGWKIYKEEWQKKYLSSSILSVYHPRFKKDYTKLAEKLAKKNIIVFDRDGRLRIGLHFFQTKDDLRGLIHYLHPY